MNRNYLPPSLKGPSNSPPSSQPQPSQVQMRRFGRTCKLPTVQEVGKLHQKNRQNGT